MSEVALAYSTDARFRGLKGRWMDRCELERSQARILAEEARRVADTPTQAKWGPGSLPGDPWGLRGIPVLGFGIPGGAMPDCRPGNARSIRRVDGSVR